MKWMRGGLPPAITFARENVWRLAQGWKKHRICEEERSEFSVRKLGTNSSSAPRDRVRDMPKSPQFIDNPHAERVRKVADLTSAKARKKTGRFLIEGPQSVREAVTQRPEIVTDVYVDLAAAPNDDIVAACEESSTMYVHEVSGDVLQHMSSDAQSVVAVATSDGFLAQPEELPFASSGLMAACWQVRDPGNEGTVIRTADASGCAAVLLVGECVDPLNPKVIRSSAGSLFHLPVCRVSEEEFFEQTSAHDLQVWAADIHGTPKNPPHDLSQVAFGGDSQTGEQAGGLSLSVDRPTVILFGNEARGLPSEMVERTSATLKIPLYGKAESLNLAMSSAVLLYTLAMSSHVGTM